MSDVARTSVNQGPGGGTDYPFVGRSDLSGVVLDFYASYEDDACAYALPFSLTVGGGNVTVRDANDETVADLLTADAYTLAWGDRTVYEWVGDTYVVRMVTVNFGDGDSVLDPRTCERTPARLKSLRVGDVVMTGGVRFEAGFNVALSGAGTVRVDGGRYVDEVSIDAVPGAGDGRVSGCDDAAPVVRRINQVTPDCGGNFVIEVDPCFRVQLPVAVATDGADRTASYATAADESAVALHSDCRPCRDCEYYVRTYRGLSRVWDRWAAVASAAEAVRDTYSSNLSRWADQKSCRDDAPTRLVVTKDSQCKVFVGASYCNKTQECVTNPEIVLTVTLYDSSGSAKAFSGSAVQVTLSASSTDGEESYAPEQSGSVFKFKPEYANPGTSVVAKMKLCVSDCQAGDSVKVALTTTPTTTTIEKSAPLTPDAASFTCGC